MLKGQTGISNLFIGVCAHAPTDECMYLHKQKEANNGILMFTIV